MVSIPNIRSKTKISLILTVLLVTGALIWWSVYPQINRVLSGGNYLTVKIYDVGQGDAILIQKGDTQILVDGGPGDAVLTHLGRDLLPWDREIELLVLSHPQADHLAGLIAVLERYQVQRVLYYPSQYDTKLYQRFLELIKSEGAEILLASAGGTVSVGEIVLQVVWPTANFRHQNVNNESVVLLLDYLYFEALLLGDAEQDAQKNLLINENVELLKVSHHGALNGTYEPLLRAIAPQLAAISSGLDNRFGHPHSRTLSILGKLGIPFLRTDLNGTITVWSDGYHFWYSTDR